MKKLYTVSLALFTAALAALFAVADDRRLTFDGIDNLSALTTLADGDFVPFYDTSARDVVKVDKKYFAITDGTGPTAAELDQLVGVSAGAISNVAKFTFRICGDAVTINNNTVYYGPGVTLTANTHDGLNCDIAAAGNVTEATADEAYLAGKAFQVTGLICHNQADANAAVSFTLRTAAGATSPSVTCTIADNDRSCAADIQTTTNIAAGATLAIAAASTADVGAGNGFVCEVLAQF